MCESKPLPGGVGAHCLSSICIHPVFITISAWGGGGAALWWMEIQYLTNWFYCTSRAFPLNAEGDSSNTVSGSAEKNCSHAKL